MSTQPNALSRSRAGLNLEYPMSLGRYEKYEEAQKAVDYLSDHEFPVQNVLIVGTDLKQLERVTGRLTRAAWPWAESSRACGSGCSSGWSSPSSTPSRREREHHPDRRVRRPLRADVGPHRLPGHGGQRDFTSVTQVVATQYEVLVEHRHAQRARELLTQMDPMAAAQAEVRAAREREAAAQQAQQQPPANP